MQTCPSTISAYRHCTPTDTANQPPPKSGYGFLRYILDTIEELPASQELLEAIAHRRRRARPGYPANSMLRLFCLKHLLNEEHNVYLLQRLASSPKLLDLCGLDRPPSESTCSRFFRHLTEQRRIIEDAIAGMVERLRAELPDIGDVLSIDGTDIESYANPKRSSPVDEDAAWGIRTVKNKSNRRTETEPYYGYKLHMLADATYHLPMQFALTPANSHESPLLPPLVRAAQETYEWLKPDYLVGDKGYDSQTNHKFLVKRGIKPIIHLRSTNDHSKLHDGIYTDLGAPTCMGGAEMTLVRTDPETGKHLYQCPAGGCKRYRSGRSMVTRCQDSHWEDPADNLRVIGIVPRQSKEWRDKYKMRMGVERYFSSGKRSRLMNKQKYLEMCKVEAHVALSILTYLGTVYTRIKAGDRKNMREMRVQV